LDYYQRYPDLVRAVTTEQILTVARQYLDTESFIVISSGPELVP
jgi:predicted Zn-dependent peptidase